MTVVQGQFTGNSSIVASYEIQAGNNVSFKVILKENKAGLREFEIILSSSGSDDYSEVYMHPFYKDFVLPWTYKKKESEDSPIHPIKNNNVIDINRRKHV